MAMETAEFTRRVFPLKYIFLTDVVPALNDVGGRWNFEVFEHHPVLTPDRWLVRLSAFFASHALGRREVSVPVDWWEHVKLRFAPAWFLQRYPVRYTVHVMEVTQIFPTCGVPAMGPSVQIVEFNQHFSEVR